MNNHAHTPKEDAAEAMSVAGDGRFNPVDVDERYVAASRYGYHSSAAVINSSNDDGTRARRRKHH
jgi:hypothetical protein